MSSRKLVGIAVVVVLALVLCGKLTFNYFSVEQPLHHVLSQDSRNQVVAATAHYDDLVDWKTLVFDIKGLSSSAKEIDVFRTFLQYAQAMKGRHFVKVILACRGKKKFTLDGSYFQQLGQEYESQNPMYTIRTFPTHLTAMDGSKPFTEYVGGVLGVLEKEMEQFTKFNDQWYIRDIAAAQIAEQEPKRQGGVSEQQPKPDYSNVKKDIMGESVALFLANNPSCRFDLPDETFPVSGSKMCVVVDSEYMKGKPAQITYAGMPVQVQAHFYHDVLFNLTFTTIGSDDCRTYHILDALKEKYREPKETQTVNGKEIRPVEFSEKNPFLFWQDGTITITYSDALSCSVSFEVDKIMEAVTKAKDAADSDKYRSQHQSQKSDM